MTWRVYKDLQLDGKIQTDHVTPADLHVDCGTEKTIVLDNVVWDDLRIASGQFERPGVSDPDIYTYNVNGGGVNTYLYEFDNNDIISFAVQIPHSYKTGENIYVHVHWTPGALGSDQNGKIVYWKMDYSWANINGAFGTMATADLKDACDGTNHKHQMSPEVEITGTDKGISSMLLCNLRRTDEATTPWDNATGPLLLEIDFHIPIDTQGSRARTTK